MNPLGSTKSLQDVFCPKCGKTGQLKRSRAKKGYNNWYYHVDHYKKHRRIGGYHGKYSSVCYLGRYVFTQYRSECYIIEDENLIIPFQLNRLIHEGYQL